MNRLLRIAAVVAFAVGFVALMWGGTTNADEWRWGCLFAGSALFALSFATT